MVTAPTIEDVAALYTDTRADDLIRMHAEYSQKAVSRELTVWDLELDGGNISELRIQTSMDLSQRLADAIGVELLHRLTGGVGRVDHHNG